MGGNSAEEKMGNAMLAVLIVAVSAVCGLAFALLGVASILIAVPWWAWVSAPFVSLALVWALAVVRGI